MVAKCGRVWHSVAWAGSVARVWHLNTAAGDTKLGSRWRCQGWANCQITHPLYLVFLVPVPIVRPRSLALKYGTRENGAAACVVRPAPAFRSPVKQWR